MPGNEGEIPELDRDKFDLHVQIRRALRAKDEGWTGIEYKPITYTPAHIQLAWKLAIGGLPVDRPLSELFLLAQEELPALLQFPDQATFEALYIRQVSRNKSNGASARDGHDDTSLSNTPVPVLENTMSFPMDLISEAVEEILLHAKQDNKGGKVSTRGLREAIYTRTGQRISFDNVHIYIHNLKTVDDETAAEGRLYWLKSTAQEQIALRMIERWFYVESTINSFDGDISETDLNSVISTDYPSSLHALRAWFGEAQAAGSKTRIYDNDGEVRYTITPADFAEARAAWEATHPEAAAYEEPAEHQLVPGGQEYPDEPAAEVVDEELHEDGEEMPAGNTKKPGMKPKLPDEAKRAFIDLAIRILQVSPGNTLSGAELFNQMKMHKYQLGQWEDRFPAGPAGFTKMFGAFSGETGQVSYKKEGITRYYSLVQSHDATPTLVAAAVDETQANPELLEALPQQIPSVIQFALDLGSTSESPDYKLADQQIAWLVIVAKGARMELTIECARWEAIGFVTTAGKSTSRYDPRTANVMLVITNTEGPHTIQNVTQVSIDFGNSWFEIPSGIFIEIHSLSDYKRKV